MDRATLVTGFLCAATVVAYADELGMLIKRLWYAVAGRTGSDIPAAALDLAARELASDEPERIERGASILRAQSGTPAIARLIPLLSHADPTVSRRAARLLYERQDPQAIEALYWYHAKQPVS